MGISDNLEENILHTVMDQNNKINELAVSHAILNGKVEGIQGSTARIESKLDRFIENIEIKFNKISEDTKEAERIASKKFAPKLAWDILKGIGVVGGSTAIIGAVKIILFR